jgi:4a-hydroxytetrahydrobiopterin dehydratase
MSLLNDDQIVRALLDSPWERDGELIARDLRFDDFKAAIGFVNRVPDLAEEAGHHPDILVHGWNRVRLELSSHSEGGITQADVDLAGRIDGLAPPQSEG